LFLLFPHLNYQINSIACQLSSTNITFASVHDSYWTHPSTVEQMNRIIREQFVILHSKPLLENLRSEFLERYKGHVIYKKSMKELKTFDLKPIPKKGDFDLTQVKDSKYFFD